MNRQGHEEATYFIGPEVEHTPAFSKKTLFVVGKPPLEQIERMVKEYKTPHVFMGANHSFAVGNLDPYWNHVITSLLDKGLWVTLDYQAHEHEEVLKLLNPGIWQCRTFVPLLGVRIPKVQTSSPNLTVKIDDIDFDATNPGVWCIHHHELTDSNRFTSWGEYGTDEVISPLAGPAHILPLRIANVASISVNEEGLKVKTTENDTANSVIQNPQDLGLDTKPDTVFADINVPGYNLEGMKRIVEQMKSDQNDQTPGLDPNSPSQLKPDASAEVINKVIEPTTPSIAAEAYADGAGEKAAKSKVKAKDKK